MSVEFDRFGAYDSATGERWDHEAQTYLRRSGSGDVLEVRPMTAQELVDYAPRPIANPAADALDAAADQAEQSLIADVRDLATQLRAAATALRGQ